jgi:hypothetical protein
MLAQLLNAFVGASQSDVVRDIELFIAGGAAVIEWLRADAIPAVERSLIFALSLYQARSRRIRQNGSQELGMRENGVWS